MMRFVFALILFLSGLSFGYGQLPDHTPMMNKYWDLLNTRTIKKGSTGTYQPYFPPPLASMQNKMVVLPGYMVPLKTAALHKNFLLSVLPIAQCEFCGEGEIPEMVEVIMDQAIKFSTKPIKIQGKLNINKDQDGATFQVLEASLVK